MFLLFAPLKSRLLKWPFATLFIVLVTFGFSIAQFQKVASFEVTSKSISVTSGVWDARKAVLMRFCGDRFLKQQCHFLAQLQPNEFADLKPFFQAYKKRYPDDGGEKLRAWKRWVSNEEPDQRFDAETKSDTTVVLYKKALAKQRSLLVQEAKKHQILVRGNAKILPVAKSLFLHVGWADLAMTILFVGLFATFLEQRAGVGGLLAVYLIGGVGANFIQACFIPFGNILAGGAAGVAAVLGAFIIYFHEEKSILARKWAFPTWAVAGGLVVMNLFVCWLVGSEASTLAHGIGFALGAIVASMQKDLFPLKRTFLFPHEQAMYYEAKNVARFEEKIELFQKIFLVNSQSFYAFRSLFSYFEKHRLNLAAFKKEHQTLVADILRECFLCSAKSDKHRYSQQVLGIVPLSWNLNLLPLNVDANLIIECAHRFQTKGYLAQSLRYYDFFLEKYAAHPRAEQAHSVIMQVFDELERFDPEFRFEMLEVLINYAKAHPTTHFNSQIRRIAQQVQKERSNAA